MSDASEQMMTTGLPVAPFARASQANFDRPLVCILGLPFDAISVAQAVQRIREDAFAGRRCFVSTPNLNFAVTARQDAAFRGSVLRSDLNLVDGASLLWVGRLLGLAVPERASGADVFEALQAHPGQPLRLYVFGGEPGAAEAACERINQRGGGVRCVGFDSAGFGSIESMSDDARIERINASGAQFVFVSLGAQKGQAWIEHNAARLKAPVLSHFGAVVNFAAGTVSRAPRWMQHAGLEWLWRIKEEPPLWRRYWRDGCVGLWLLLTRVLPDVWFASARTDAARKPPRLELVDGAAAQVLRLSGDWHDRADFRELRAVLGRCAAHQRRLQIDLAAVGAIGNTATALLLRAAGRWAARGGFEVVSISATAAAALRRKLADQTLLGPLVDGPAAGV